jgi:anti-sigma factor RsiW
MPIVPWGQIVQEYIAEDRCVTQHTFIWPNTRSFIGNPVDFHHLFLPPLPKHAVDCQQFQQLISPAVDRRLNRLEMEAFVDHAAKCSTCRYDYELESSVKSVVQTRLKMVRTPRAVTDSIARRICQIEEEQARDEKHRPLSGFFDRSLVKPLLLFALVCAVVLAVVFSPFGFGTLPALDGSNDLLSQSVSNFHAVLAGVLQPQVVSDRPEQLRVALSERTNFPVHVPVVSSWTLMGGSAIEYRGMQYAHVMYEREGEVIYIFQAPFDRVVSGSELVLSDVAKEELTRTGWFSEPSPGGDTVILWTRGNTLCAAVSRISRTELLGYLTSSNAPSM